MNIYNGTAHAINIFTLQQCDTSNPRKLLVNAGEAPSYVIPAGVNLNCTKSNYDIDSSAFPFQVKGAVRFDSVESLPEGYDIYIVSNLFRSAYEKLVGDTSQLATVDGVVYSNADPENPRPCGCLGLAVG